MSTTIYAFQTGETLNPATGEGSPFYLDGFRQQMIYVIRKLGGKTPIAFTSYGPIAGMFINARVSVIADQSNRNLGTYIVEGIRIGGITLGEIPNRKIRHAVAK